MSKVRNLEKQVAELKQKRQFNSEIFLELSEIFNSLCNLAKSYCGKTFYVNYCYGIVKNDLLEVEIFITPKNKNLVGYGLELKIHHNATREHKLDIFMKEMALILNR